jgi:hypothetical protein
MAGASHRRASVAEFAQGRYRDRIRVIACVDSSTTGKRPGRRVEDACGRDVMLPDVPLRGQTEKRRRAAANWSSPIGPSLPPRKNTISSLSLFFFLSPFFILQPRTPVWLHLSVLLITIRSLLVLVFENFTAFDPRCLEMSG